jgi:hypothetical protein
MLAASDSRMIKAGIERITGSEIGCGLRCMRYDALRIVQEFDSPEPEFDLQNK